MIARLLLTKPEPFRADAVLAFVGYGRDDYLPSICQMTVAGMVGGVVRVYDESDAAVTADDRVTIIPLGLTEAIHAFLRGVSPQYRRTAHRVLADCVPEKKEDASSGADDEAHQRLDAEFDELEWTEFLSPMLNIVETLPLVETTRLADSLVGLASLRQLIQGKSSVGGPVDVARVTKHAGFKWVRSKRMGSSDLLGH